MGSDRTFTCSERNAMFEHRAHLPSVDSKHRRAPTLSLFSLSLVLFVAYPLHLFLSLSLFLSVALSLLLPPALSLSRLALSREGSERATEIN
jgi:hypothetical protein